MSVCVSDSHWNDKVLKCKHTLTFQDLIDNWDVMFTDSLKVRKRNIQRIHVKKGTFKVSTHTYIWLGGAKRKKGTRKMRAGKSVAADNNLCVKVIQYEGYKQILNKDQVFV